jgi:hypothetical protein
MYDIEQETMNRRYLKFFCVLIVAVVAIATTSYSDSSLTEKRDQALEGIALCLKHDDAAGRDCKNMNKNVQTLVDVYHQGDKSVLPTLLQFGYLTDFFGEALIGDPDGFLSAVARLPEPNQHAIGLGIAGGRFGLLRPQFDTVRASLMGVTGSSPNYRVARDCLRTLETENASFLDNYFPPHTFMNDARDFRVHWFSRELHALEEKPLWPPASENERTYRITVLPALTGPESVTLNVALDGAGQIEFRSADARHQHMSAEKPLPISPQQAIDFSSSLDRIQFLKMPTEVTQSGFDGADWIVEVVQDGKYHVVLRWCPGKTPLGELGRNLFMLAGHKMSGGC